VKSIVESSIPSISYLPQGLTTAEVAKSDDFTDLISLPVFMFQCLIVMSKDNVERFIAYI